MTVKENVQFSAIPIIPKWPKVCRINAAWQKPCPKEVRSWFFKWVKIQSHEHNLPTRQKVVLGVPFNNQLFKWQFLHTRAPGGSGTFCHSSLQKRSTDWNSTSWLWCRSWNHISRLHIPFTNIDKEVFFFTSACILKKNKKSFFISFLKGSVSLWNINILPNKASSCSASLWHGWFC